MASFIGIPGLLNAIEKGGDVFNLIRRADQETIISSSQPKEWEARNLKQKYFLKNFLYDYEKKGNESNTFIAFSPLEIKKALKEEGFESGFETEIPEKFDPFQFGMMSILNSFPEWETEGIAIKIGQYQGVKIERDKSGARIFSTPRRENLVVGIPVKSEMVYMTIAEKALKGMELFHAISQIRRGLVQSSFQYSYGYIIFPEVKLKLLSNIEWLSGLSFLSGGKKAEIKNIFQLANISIKTRKKPSLSDYYKGKTLSIDNPFYLWVEKPGMVPSLCAYIEQRDWIKY